MLSLSTVSRLHYIAILIIAILAPCRVLASTLLGKITLPNAADRAAANGVVVLLSSSEEELKRGHPERAARTDGDGKFILSDISPGTYYIMIDRGAFLRTNSSMNLSGYICPPTPVRVEVGPEPRTVEFALHEGASVRGRLVADDDKPIAVALTGSTAHSRFGYMVGDGVFEINGLPPGEDDHIIISPVKDSRFVYSKDLFVQGAKLKAGIVFDAGDVKFVSLTGHVNFRGTVTGKDGKLLAGIVIFNMINDQDSIRGTLVVKDGRFEQEFPPGNYVIVNPAKRETPVATTQLSSGRIVEMNVAVGG